jgi:hypothetical protein
MGQGFAALIVRCQSLGKRGLKKGKGSCQITKSGNNGFNLRGREAQPLRTCMRTSERWHLEECLKWCMRSSL